jgi:hypothetical protein
VLGGGGEGEPVDGGGGEGDEGDGEGEELPELSLVLMKASAWLPYSCP